MFGMLVSKKHEPLFLSSFDSIPLKKVQLQFPQLPTEYTPEHNPVLDSLVNAYLFREFKPQCQPGSYSKKPLLQGLKSPGYRVQYTRPASAVLHRILREQSVLQDYAHIVKNITLDDSTRQSAVQLANHSPFMHQLSWFNHFTDFRQLGNNEFLALLCATLLYQQCFIQHVSAPEIQLFYQGVCSGYINLQLAQESEYNPLHSFLAPLIHYIGLIVIHRELKHYEQLPDAEQLLTEINELHLKLGYWTAKDWGLPDDILFILKERFMHLDDPSPASLLMQKSEHAYLAIQLCQQGLLSRKHTKSFLKAMQLENHHFMERVGTTH